MPTYTIVREIGPEDVTVTLAGPRIYGLLASRRPTPVSESDRYGDAKMFRVRCLNGCSLACPDEGVHYCEGVSYQHIGMTPEHRVVIERRA